MNVRSILLLYLYTYIYIYVYTHTYTHICKYIYIYIFALNLFLNPNTPRFTGHEPPTNALSISWFHWFLGSPVV